MKTQYYTATSLDGFIATEDHSLDWLFPLGDVNATSYPSFIAGVGALAMGSSTYEWMLRHALTIKSHMGSAWPYKQPAWVFSSRALPIVEGAALTFVRGDVAPVHAEMRAAAGGKNIWIVGGGDLAGQFYDTNPPLRLVSTRQVGSGFAELRYEVPRADRRG
jgi:dihydrofolate reductase